MLAQQKHIIHTFSHILAFGRQQIKSTLLYIYLCKHLRKFYRSAQGELDQLNFLNLILNGNESIQNLIRSSGFDVDVAKSNDTETNKEKQKNQPGVLGVFFQFVAYYLGISCVVDIELCSKKGRLRAIGVGVGEGDPRDKCVREVKLIPRVIGYSLQFLQLYQLFSKTQQYLSQNQPTLAQTSLQHKQPTYFQNPHQPHIHPFPPTLPLLLNLSQLSYTQNDYITCISKCKQFLHTIESTTQLQIHQGSISESGSSFLSNFVTRSLFTSQCVPVYMLLIKCYSKFSKQKFNQSLKECIICAVDNFGDYSSVVVMVFEFVALVFSTNGDYTNAQAYMRAAINIADKVYKGISLFRIGQLYLELSRILMYLGKLEQSNEYLSRSQKIYESEGTQSQLTNLFLFTLQSHIKSSNPESLSSQQKILQLLHHISTLLQQSSNPLQTVKLFYTLMYQAGVKFGKRDLWSKAVNQLWKLDLFCKIDALEMVYKAVGAKFQALNRGGWRDVLQKWNLSKEKSILIVQKGLSSFKNIVEMVEEVFTQEDPEIFPAIVKVLPTEIFKSF